MYVDQSWTWRCNKVLHYFVDFQIADSQNVEIICIVDIKMAY
jgi:hypothetical protein